MIFITLSEYGIAGGLASKLDIKERKVVRRIIYFNHTCCQNPQVESNSNNFHVTVPILDHLTSDLEIRFSGDEPTSYCGL